MYKVVIVDDEPLARQLIQALLADHSQFEVVASCCDGFEGFKAIKEHRPHLVFLDVQMPRLSGFEMLELIDERPSVIFTTAFDEYAVQAFDSHAIDYLLKPILKDRFDTAIGKWMKQTSPVVAVSPETLPDVRIGEGYRHRIVVKDNGLIRIIPEKDIHYVEADDDYVRIYTKAGTYMKKNTLAQIEQQLDPEQFVKVHRSYLIPVDQLVRIEPYEKDSHLALLHCGAKVTVSKAGMQKLKSVLGW